ncbi:MAG: hypothetical protein KDC07_01645 [Chitinophagaceae bacterium]|nr:hypothetical protein [Chitinophagaceae bacterium]MCB9044578.1 hypothetical protein [Chitinophagales bacterium]
MGKVYTVFLNGKRIATTLFEHGDPPMGVVLGALRLEGIESGYDFFRAYCVANHIEHTDHAEDRIIITESKIHGLVVLNTDGKEIKGVGEQISGMDGDTFQIDIFGIPYPFYEEEFPDHVSKYNELFKDKSP